MRTEKKKKLPPLFGSDIRVQYERLTARFFVCMSVAVGEKRPETQGAFQTDPGTKPEKHVAAIDPGIRTFATLWGGRERIVEWGKKRRKE